MEKAYNVPSVVYEEEESTFFKLIFNTVKELSSFKIKQRPVDISIDACFRQSPTNENLRVFLSSPAIRGLWTNVWRGKGVSFFDSNLMLKI